MRDPGILSIQSSNADGNLNKHKQADTKGGKKEKSCPPTVKRNDGKRPKRRERRHGHATENERKGVFLSQNLPTEGVQRKDTKNFW